ncbi:MAG: LPS export ABC transporter periplasmic protein LptC, partial [Chitinophagaceae bacterium]|nr:LPS export ABC transporter periplasmic protein LptC [Chitinophagaceae bacterium]
MINRFNNISTLLAAIIMGCFFVTSCENEIKTVQDLGKRTLGVEEAKNIESYMSQAGKMRAKLSAPLMLRYLLDTPKVEFTKTMHVDFFDDTLGVESQLNCKYGRYLENDNKVYLRDSVVVFNRTGDTLWTDELLWDQIKQEFYTDKFVRLKKGFNSTYILGYGG